MRFPHSWLDACSKMGIIRRMPRFPCAHLAALCFTAALVTSCGGNPSPRRPIAPPNPQSQPSGNSSAVPSTPPPPIAGESAIVIDAQRGRVLYAKNADVPRPVASTQKIITALCILDAGNVDSTVTIEATDGACEPTKLDLKPGDHYTRRELLKVLVVKSANDVARALARDVGGSQEGFAALMNSKAASLGMRNSNFINPNGLPMPGQHSSARDMAIAARAAYRSPLFRSYAATKAFTFQFNNGRTREIENTNHLLKSLPYCDGMKTGTTNQAGRCLVASGSLNGRSAITVILKDNTANIWKDSEKLLRWALERPAAPAN